MATEYLSGWPLSSWISPGAAFFLFVNVLIGAIVVTSRGHQAGRGRAAASTRRLCRSASSMVLDRLRSFSMFSVHPDPTEMEERYSTSSPLELEAEEEQQPQPQPAVVEPARSPVAAVAAAADGASSEIAKEEAAEAGKDLPTSSNEAHGLLLQLQQGHGGRQQPPSSVHVVVTAADATAAVEIKEEEEKKAEQEATMQRAPASRRGTTEEAAEGKAALNARAESFIRKFREDLKLERLNSIINYTRTLRRGVGAPQPTAQ
ncbi:uncharacterized protein LOC100276545 [Zea mays]|jgi:hypothetical protein|uniref:DUF4408 domain-containing protein n=1 Tax=Zea mays TaxID=4577 RepID=A0A1D6KPQ2_MAIZE|nr:uncharacterized protein LOC100276545 [Zea mays]ONM04775.1 hypothetical protein ZEAMMB73_Zm00001d032287 [Zea mays]|eukprot:NP_001143780.2 uncharacterized protein LOC100276545 [Zea mays]